MDNHMKYGGPTWVEQYVQHILKQTMPTLDLQAMSGASNTEITEIDDAVMVKVHLPDKTDAAQIRIYVSAHQVKLEGNTDGKLQLLHLPHPVVPASSKAVYKNGILQLHMRKQEKEGPFFEVDVKYI